MRATHGDARPPEATYDGGHPDAVWGVRGLMLEAIVPDRPAERRMRGRMYAMRAMERLGLWGEENLIPTLARRPELRWLADEDGARWNILRQLGCIGERESFDEAVEWALRNRPGPEQVGDHLWRIRTGGASAARTATEARRGPRRPHPTRNRAQEKEG